MDALGKWMIIRYQTNTLPKWMFPKNICSDHPCCKMVSAAFKNVPQWPLPSLLYLSFFFTRLTASFRTVFRSLGRMLTFFDGLYSWKFFNVLGCDIMKHQCGSSSPKFKINTQLLNPLTPCTFLHEETVISSRLIKAKGTVSREWLPRQNIPAGPLTNWLKRFRFVKIFYTKTNCCAYSKSTPTRNFHTVKN